MSDLSDALLAGMRAAPNLDPSMLYGVAQTSALDDVPDNATAAQAFGDITKRKGYLEAQDSNVQVSAWASSTADEQKMLSAAGYKPPAMHKQSSGIFAAAGHFLGDVATAGFVKPAEEIAKGVGVALHYLGAPLRQVQHGYRATQLMEGEGKADLLSSLENSVMFSGASPLHSIAGLVRTATGDQLPGYQGAGVSLSPAEWAKAWRASEHGEQTFDPHQVTKIEGQFAPDTVDLARQIAGGTSIDDLVKAAPADQKQALVARIQSDTDLKAAVQQFQNAKLSVGRRVVGSDLGVTHPLLHQVLSGGIDAMVDWYTDPVVVGTKATHAAEIAKYLVRGPEDVERLNKLPQVDRAAADMADALNSGGGGNAQALIQRWPKMAPIAEQLVKEGVDSKEKVGQWFAGQSGMSAMLSGRAGGALKDGVLMPHLSVVDQQALNLKGGLSKAIDWAADTPARIAAQTGDDQTLSLIDRAKVRGIGGPGRIAKQLTTLTAKGVAFDPSSEKAITMVQRLANTVLPSERVADVVNAWAAAPDLATKRDIYKGLLSEMFDHAGITATDEGRQWASGFISKIDDAVTKPVYSASGADTVIRDGVDARRGLDTPQFSTEWAMPSYKDLWAQSKRVGVLGRIYGGTVNADGVDRFMNGVWKPSMLLRLGFPIRAGGEELVGAIMREGPLGLIRGRLAAGATTGEALGEADKILPLHPLANVWDRLAGHLPAPIVDAINTPADFAGAVIGDRTRRAFRAVEGKLAGQDYMNAARELWHAGPLQEAFTSEIAATESRAAGYLDDGPSVVKVAKDGGRARPAYLSPTGNFRNYLPGDDLYVQQWKKGLDELGQGPLFRAALTGVGDREAQVQSVVDRINSDGYAKAKQFADRALYTRDGRIVGSAATQDEADLDWANAVVDHVNSLVHDEGGTLIDGLPAKVLAREAPSVADLSQIPLEARPGPVKGREMVSVSGNWVRDIMDRGFEQVVGRPMDWMVRQPLFIHNYAVSLKEAEAVRPLIQSDQVLTKLVDDAGQPLAVYHGTIHDFQTFDMAEAGKRALQGEAEPAIYFSKNRAVAEQYVTLRGGVADELGQVKGTPTVKQAYLDIQNPFHSTEAGPYSADLVARLKGEGYDSIIYDRPSTVSGAHDASEVAVFDPSQIHDTPSGVIQGGVNADEHVRQIAVDRAVAKTIPFIHDAQMRSQMAVVGRNLSPFWFAQEQFYKRWVNIAKHSPEAFRQAQLTMMGLRHSGVIHTDDSGNDFFIYPGPAVVQNAISKGFEMFTGHKVSLPLPVGFSGQVRFATPGLERLGVPSFGPLVGIPMRYMAQRFPELDQVESGVLGERGAGRAYWEQITPTTVSRLIHVAIDSPDTNSQMASASMQAMAYLEAKGFAPSPDAGSVEIEAYKDRVKNWTRLLFLNRLLFGYAAPASPDLQMDPDNLNKRYRELLGQLPIEQAQAEFMAEHPDANAYTVFQSKSSSGAALPATQHAADFMANNEAFLATYPQAGGWFVPQTPDDTKFSLPAYREQLALELRTRKSPDQFYSDLKYGEAAGQYFDNRDRKDVLLEGTNGPTATKLRVTNPKLLAEAVAQGATATAAAGTRRQTVSATWASWKADYLAGHQVFAERLTSPDSANQRAAALDQTRKALADPRLPATPQTQGLQQLVDGYGLVQTEVMRLAGQTSQAAADKKKAVKSAFTMWAEKFTGDHPETKGFYDTVLRPEVDA